MIPYKVVRLSFAPARDFVVRHHYAHGCHNGPTLCAGLIDGEHLIGVLMFATPCSEAVRSSVFGPERRHAVTELHRLVCLDVTPKNTESWFIARALRMLQAEREHVEAVVSFADEGHGHTDQLGTVIHLLVRPHDQRHPGWAALQEIKTAICGPEAWGFEVFPRESELVDQANLYHIWVVWDFEKVPRLRV